MLKKDTVPTLFPEFPDHLHPTPAKKRRVLDRSVDCSVNDSVVDSSMQESPVSHKELLRVIELDHGSYALNSHTATKRLFWMQDKLEHFLRMNKALKIRLRRNIQKNASLNEVLCNLHERHLLAKEDAILLEKR